MVQQPLISQSKQFPLSIQTFKQKQFQRQAGAVRVSCICKPSFNSKQFFALSQIPQHLQERNHTTGNRSLASSIMAARLSSTVTHQTGCQLAVHEATNQSPSICSQQLISIVSHQSTPRNHPTPHISVHDKQQQKQKDGNHVANLKPPNKHANTVQFITCTPTMSLRPVPQTPNRPTEANHTLRPRPSPCPSPDRTLQTDLPRNETSTRGWLPDSLPQANVACSLGSSNTTTGPF
jgi:hypothetical protein